MFDKAYMDNVAQVETYKREVEIKAYKGFRQYSVGAIYVIEYLGYNKTPNRVRTYKTYSRMIETWQNIVSGEIDYTNF